MPRSTCSTSGWERRRALLVVALGMALLVPVIVSDGSATTAIRPAPGTPDPKAMVLTTADLGRAKVTLQRYYKDRDFPSLISYERELEDGRLGSTPLLLVNSEAEIGVSVDSTARFLRDLRLVLGSKQGRAFVAALIRQELGGDESFASITLGHPRKLGVGIDSFDLPMTLELLGFRAELHLASFRVEQVLGNVLVVGEPGRRVSLAVMKRVARVMAGRMRAELVPTNTVAPGISGSPVAGETLVASPGTWSGSARTFRFQWQRCNAAGVVCASLPAATGQQYVVALADLGSTLRVSVRPGSAPVGAAVPSAPTSVVTGFVDTFNGDQVSSFWALGATGVGPRIVQANGRLEVTLPAGTALGPAGYANTFAFMTCRLPGDFDMQVDYALLTGPPADGTNIGFDAAEFTGDVYSGQHGMYIQNAGAGGQGISTHFPGDNSFVSDRARSGTLRLARRTIGGVTTVTASRPGTSWAFTSAPYAPPTSQAANLNVFTHLSPFPAEVRVAYDNFRITSGVITC